MKVFRLANKQGLSARICDYGARIIDLQVSDRRGEFANIVLGHASPEDYLDDDFYLGAIVGRYAGRIEKGQFNVGSRRYLLARNDGDNHLHGGLRGFDQRTWLPDAQTSGHSLRLSLTSEHLDQGYPGRLHISVTYTLTDDGLCIDYQAESDATTVINLTNHSYFNLTGKPSSNILDHCLQVNATHFLPLSHKLIPTGEIAKVAGTDLDFQREVRIGERIHSHDDQLQLAAGIDHTWVVNNDDSGFLSHAATLSEKESGRVMQVWTTEPGLQVYTGNFLNGTHYGKYQGVCLESQHFPNSPNVDHFPSTRLDPGDSYRSQTIYRFSVQ